MDGETNKTSRGTIIKAPDASPGIVIIDGAQRTFVVEGLWRSPVAPELNMVVEALLDAQGALLALTVVDAQQLQKERLGQLSGVAQEQGKLAADLARQGTSALVARMGRVPLAAALILVVAWFFMPAVIFGAPPLGRLLTMWDVLGVDLGNPMAGAESHGLFALLGLLALAGPFAAPFAQRAEHVRTAFDHRPDTRGEVSRRVGSTARLLRGRAACG